jgi:hypothetical protein
MFDKRLLIVEDKDTIRNIMKNMYLKIGSTLFNKTIKRSILENLLKIEQYTGIGFDLDYRLIFIEFIIENLQLDNSYI